MEKLLFVLPTSLEEALVAAHVLSQYMITRLIMQRDARHVTVVCPIPELKDFVKACWTFVEVVDEATEQQVEEAEVTFQFDADRSYLVTKEVKKGIADTFAIQLGVGLWRSLPAVLVEDRPEERGVVLVAERNVLDGTDESWEWPYREQFIEMGHEREIVMTFLDSKAGFVETRAAIGRASVIVGVRSTATLIAAAANKLVMELQPKDKGHQDWFKKTDKSFYQMMYGNLHNMTADFVWKHVSLMVSKLQSSKPRQTAYQTEEVSCSIQI